MCVTAASSRKKNQFIIQPSCPRETTRLRDRTGIYPVRGNKKRTGVPRLIRPSRPLKITLRGKSATPEAALGEKSRSTRRLPPGDHAPGCPLTAEPEWGWVLGSPNARRQSWEGPRQPGWMRSLLSRAESERLVLQRAAPRAHQPGLGSQAPVQGGPIGGLAVTKVGMFTPWEWARVRTPSP